MFQPQEIGEVQKEEGPYLKPEEWQIGMSYRYYNAYKHYEGNERQWHRDSLGNNVFNNMNIVTLAATYGITQRLSGTLHVPLMYGQWSIPRPTNPPGTRYFQKSYGVGDASLSGHFWLLNPIRHTRENIAVGLGVKAPTGDSDFNCEFPDGNGENLKQRLVDTSIQPGDGGWGATFDLQAFKQFSKVALFASGLYLATPKNLGTFRPDRTPNPERPFYEWYSVSDAYQARVGGATPIPWVNGLSTSLSALWEGIPPEDIIGGSDGFRRPGWSLAANPGVSYGSRQGTFSLSVPWVFARERQKTMSDGVPREGDATIADFEILLDFQKSFGK